MRRLLLPLLLCLALPLEAPAASPATRAHLQDFDAFWRAIDQGYAYFDRNRATWKRARETWRPRAARATTRAELLAALEGAAAVLHDDAVTLSESGPASARRVPGETDLWAEWKGRDAVIEAVRTYGDADVAGLRPGLVVTRIDGRPVAAAMRKSLGGAADKAARDWALRHALAGPRTGTMRIETLDGSRRRTFEIERQPAAPANGPPVAGRRIGEDRDLGYIRIRHGLDHEQLAAHFDAALQPLKDTRALILDLREVNGAGGRAATTAILARFVQRESPWQQRAGRGVPKAIDVVAPRGDTYRAPVVVLVDRWTAGEGEALAAGMHAAAGARLVGTRMAGLHGELRETRLPHSGIAVRFPAERAFHVDGTPRESLRPTVEIDLAAPSGGPGDPILYQALKLLEKR